MKLRDRLFISGVFLCCITVPQSALAQLIRGDDLTPTNVVGDCNAQCNITGGTRRGRNLFHSFEEFNVGENQRVRFATPARVENILSRVTGKNPSNIQGTLSVGGKVNLFLLNPSGIVFGSNAQLDLRGAFIATTANSFVFSDGSEFSAAQPQVPTLLAISVPVGLQFGQAPRNIRSQGNLQVDPGRTLALIGGAITLRGGSLVAGGLATAEGGRIELGSVARGRVNLTTTARGFTFGYEHVQDFQDIWISQGVTVSTSGEVGGAIRIQSRNLTLTGNSDITSGTLGVEPGEPLIISAAGSVRLSEGSSVGTFTESRESTGNAGNVVVRASNSVILNRSILDQDGLTSIFSQVCLISPNCETVRGNGGNLTIATERLHIQHARLETSTFGAGRGGNIEVTAPDILLFGEIPGNRNGQTVYQSSGIYTQVAEGAIARAGNAGNLTIHTERLVARAGGQVSSATFEGGNGGIVTVNASDILLSGAILHQTNPDKGNSGIFASAEPEAIGNAGEVNINTRQLRLQDRAEISVRNFGGQAGSLRIVADTITLDNARLTARTASGNGGNIILQDLDQLSMRRGSQVTAEALNSANGGNVVIAADTVTAVPDQNNDILANADRGNGGNILIFTRQPLSGLEERSSKPENSTNDIDASSQFGQAGTVSISLPIDTELQSLTLASAEPVQGCQVEGGQSTAEFFNTGRGGLPPNPYEPLSSNAILDDVRLPTPETAPPDGTISLSESTDPSEQAIVEAGAWVMNKQGQVVLVSEAPAPFRRCQLR